MEIHELSGDDGTIPVRQAERLAVPAPSPGVETYVLAGDGEVFAGFPVHETAEDHITVRHFPLQPAGHFQLPAVRYAAE